MSANVAARLIERAQLHPDRIAIEDSRKRRGGAVSFGELERRVSAVAARMRQEGVRPGDPVLLFVPMSADLYVALLAVFHVGGTAVFLDAWADRARLETAVKLARPELLIAPAPVHILRLVSPSLRRIPRRWFAGSALRPRLRAASGDPEAPADVEPSAPALITFTTGSTGAPKAAVRSHGLLWAQHEALADHLRLRPEDVDMPTLPIFVLNNLALGIPSVIPAFDPRRPAEIDPARIERQMRRQGVTTTSGSPAFYARMGEWCRDRGRTLDVRLWTGGAPVHPPLAGLLDEVTGGRAHVVYGSTEAEPIAGISAAEMVRLARTEPTPLGICCGRPVPQVELRIIRPHDGPVELGDKEWQDWELSRGEVGEIVVAGDHVVGAYLHAPEETRRHKIREGERLWHRTGDAGRLDEEGRLWLMGRVASRVVRDGVTWWSTPPEVRAMSVAGVRHAAFFGLPDQRMGQRTVLCVEADDLDGLEGSVRRSVAPTPVDQLHVVRSIPRDPRHASKTDLERLRQLVQMTR